ncbi:hypothetical protein AVEN_216459-1 [Araneus ventricosus]|uniref:Uncharacterized protein n=1 Tax=Araneus ventricosus TaxID=182803 RepID=A0A4Y2BP97_ARAVE|nr:hypothetical protein AVEN_216459-1 [Araneus ventricosus]
MLFLLIGTPPPDFQTIRHPTSLKTFVHETFNVHQGHRHSASFVKLGSLPANLWRPKSKTQPPGHRGPSNERKQIYQKVIIIYDRCRTVANPGGGYRAIAPPPEPSQNS